VGRGKKAGLSSRRRGRPSPWSRCGRSRPMATATSSGPCATAIFPHWGRTFLGQKAGPPGSAQRDARAHLSEIGGVMVTPSSERRPRAWWFRRRDGPHPGGGGAGERPPARAPREELVVTFVPPGRPLALHRVPHHRERSHHDRGAGCGLRHPAPPQGGLSSASPARRGFRGIGDPARGILRDLAGVLRGQDLLLPIGEGRDDVLPLRRPTGDARFRLQARRRRPRCLDVAGAVGGDPRLLSGRAVPAHVRRRQHVQAAAVVVRARAQRVRPVGQGRHARPVLRPAGQRLDQRRASPRLPRTVGDQAGLGSSSAR
jgi:hypothetical protein